MHSTGSDVHTVTSLTISRGFKLVWNLPQFFEPFREALGASVVKRADEAQSLGIDSRAFRLTDIHGEVVREILV